MMSPFGMKVSLQKTKLLVAGHNVQDEERLPIVIRDTSIEHVDGFSYLGSLVKSNGRIDAEIDKRIANASRAFGALRPAVFKDTHLSVTTKRKVYQACVLSVLLYGGECWTPLKRHLKKLNSFHHRCIRTVLGITNKRQWEERISTTTVREQWGDVETIDTKLMRRRLGWLGHLARMPDHRYPRICMFGWLPQTHPCGGPRKRWRDGVKKDMATTNIKEHSWHSDALERRKWKESYEQGLHTYNQQQQTQRRSDTVKDVLCTKCGKHFQRESDKACHKCIDERNKPVREQKGAINCETCDSWFRSRGGKAVHKCNQDI